MKLYPTQRYIHESAIDVPDIPPESLVSSYEAYRALGASKCNKGCGPDGISNRILKTFAFERGLVKHIAEREIHARSPEERNCSPFA